MAKAAVHKRMGRARRPTPRDLALTLIQEAEEKGIRLDERLREVQGRSGYGAEDRAFVRELVYGTVRWRGRIDTALATCLSGDPKDLPRPVRNVLRLGAYQILFMDRVPDWAAVNEAVEQTRRNGFEGFVKLVNAVLRVAARTAATDSQGGISAYEDADSLAEGESHPAWMVRRWTERWGLEAAVRVCRANNERSPLTLRVNRRLATMEIVEDALQEAGARVRRGSLWPGSLIVQGGPPITRLPGFREGWFSVQDQAASWMAQLMDVRPGDWVWDVCAGPGGKTVHLAERMDDAGFVLATDTHARRLAKVAGNARRMRLKSVYAVSADAASDVVRDFAFDAVLVDAPCSGLGVLRRHPEAKWNKEETDILRMSAVETRILRKASRAVRPGGSMLYCVCSNEDEETFQVVHAFEKSSEGGGFKRENLSATMPDGPDGPRRFIIEGGCYQVHPGDAASDGFFAARWRRKPSDESV